jgi:putative addiction module component (TIGR02574 family)
MALPKLDLENLTADERLALIEKIWDSLAAVDVPLTAPQHDELARRLEDLERNPDDAVTWAEAQRRIRERKR